ncbi:D-Ala-D-Ala carboxypeptidase family metallohydrolase [Acidovorax sp. K2F]|uniref:D-Ala-D-Ala carboxypeptidase family metallohydrolase n=1 Tax=Acidovorax sp. K2F TaxID=2978125 RepID=UPI0021B0CEF1|nr:D-Ala-D-Ala carboxypeptidase family metallohydrolase [Acidovorax sp. K2F]MCT6721683.1 D-Ala-D-Ala carboxypeptidase family metallohydrolase [Acidovorax sp. K2F]
MKLTEHFTLAELTASSKARQLGLDNTPPPEIVPRLVLTAEMLERIRSTLGVPITVTSGYRNRQVNEAVGGVTSSDHTQGHAADIQAPSYGTPTQIARCLAPLVSVLGIGQLILEGVKGKQWVHVSTRVPDKASNRVITITDQGAQLGIQELP